MSNPLEQTPAGEVRKSDPGTPSSGGKPDIDLTAKIKTEDGEVTVAQLLEDRKKAAQFQAEAAALRQYKEHTGRLLKGGDNLDPRVREESIRAILTEQGFQPDEIEEYVNNTLQVQAAPEPEPQVNQDVVNLRAEMEQMRKDRQKEQVNRLKAELNSSADKVLDGDGDMKLLLGKIKDLRGEEGLPEARLKLLEELQRQTVTNMRIRAAATGATVEESWVYEEARKAAKTVYKSYLSVIGDPNKIMRVPETATGEDILRTRPPVSAPAYQRGDTMETVTDKVRNFSNDVLMRLSAGLGEGDGQSKA